MTPGCHPQCSHQMRLCEEPALPRICWAWFLCADSPSLARLADLYQQQGANPPRRLGCWARVPQDHGLAQRPAYLHPGAPAELERHSRVKTGTEHRRLGSERGSGCRACADSLGVQGLCRSLASGRSYLYFTWLNSMTGFNCSEL